MEDCIFCKIAKKELASEVLFEDENILAFADIHPVAPVHILVIPKKHIASVAEITKQDEALMGKMIFRAKELAEKFKADKGGYKLLLRVGDDGGQEVPHIHLHLIGGGKLYEEIRLA